MAAGTYNFVGEFAIELGATLLREIVWADSESDPIDLTGYTARMQIRRSVNNPAVLADMTTENGGITLGTTDGKIALELTAEHTSEISAKAGVYDLELIDGDGFVTRLLQGEVEFSPETTRAVTA